MERLPFKGSWKCPGCGSITEFRFEVDRRKMDRAFNPARYIAQERIQWARQAADDHAKRGCDRPV